MRVIDTRSGPAPAGSSDGFDVRRLLEGLPLAAYMCDADGFITFFNRRAAQAWGREPKIHDPADRYCGSWRMWSPDGSPVPHAQCWMARCLRERKVFDGEEIVVERPDGSRLLVEVHATPFFDDHGALNGAVNIVLDITDRKRAETALKETHRRKDEFLATLAHELRNPLAPIRNAVELLRIRNLTEQERQEARDIIERQLCQMSRLVDDLLDASRITTGKIRLQKTPVSLATVVSDAVELSRHLIDASEHELTITLPPGTVELDGDAIRLVQVFSNLLTNAAKYTPQGGQILLTAELQDGEAVVSVRDTGIGIDAQHLPHVFEMFSQVAPALERSQGGLGIGLSLVRGLVELHGGSIEPRSAGVGKGSEFIVRLSLAGTLRRVEDAKLEPSSLPTEPPTRRRVLVVDDNRDAAQSLAMLLREMGHETRTSSDGLEAVQAAATFQPDVMLLDIGLPNLDGYEVARRIRRQPWGKRILLAALTGWGQDEDKSGSKTAGFDRHLTKPVEPFALRELLASQPEGGGRPPAPIPRPARENLRPGPIHSSAR